MSDVLLNEILKKLGEIHGALKGSSGGSPGAKAPGTVASAPAAPDPAVAAKAAADRKAKATAAATAAAAKTTAKGLPPDTTKAPGGKHTLGQVRTIIRQVVDNPALGFASAKEVLLDDGGGAQKVPDVKPELYDNVFEACQVLLSNDGAGTPAAPADDNDLM
jgi:hypothetical protein